MSAKTTAFRALRRFGGAVALYTAIVSCGDGPTGLKTPVPDRVVMSFVGSTNMTAIGDSLTISVLILDAKGTPINNVPFSYTSTAPGIVESLGGGVFRAQGNGASSIIVALDTPVRHRVGGSTQLVRLADTIPVQVQQVPTQLGVAAFDTLFWSLNTKRPIVATLADARGHAVPGTIAKVSWLSGDTTVAKVDTLGVVTANGDGVAQVTGAFGTLAKTLAVRVSAHIPLSRCVTFTSGSTPSTACQALTLTVRQP